ncbi:terminal uridylyl transferase 7 [Homo sapiens]|uniref:Isoform 4 of Terminal uridylyltransferase 7 n=1 Tax=Homo sapiens TaxID=9606 RepID=Q5VYS8-4|nr:terminal uridylyltransferase 7 isoform 2 [Homo sapiens]KAI4007568.1 terminal uridylyl transferase 7 [Homo sapiens]|eukprot:NP_001172003.1 terminal uridylyltransferase 7 isoform 2 [Homo sapiens]
MGDTAKPYFVKRTKDRGTMDDDDFRRGHPQQDYLIIDDHAKGHGSKMEKGLQKKKITPGNYGNTPRKGPCAVSSNPYAFKNPIYSQPAWMNDSHKDQSKRWLSDEHTGNSDNWREFKPGPRIPVINRQRKDSFQENEDGYRWQDTRGCRTVRRLFHKDLTSLETTSEMEAGSPENKKQRSRPRKPRKTRNEENEQDGDLEGPVIDESVLSTKELLGLQQAEERLKRDCIDRLKRRPRNYPTAKYTCRLCDVLIESIAFAHKHIKEKRHKKNIKEKQEEELLTTLPPPTPSQINAVGIAIDKVVQEFGLHNENLEQRLEIKRIMENVFQHKLPDCSLRLYGSSCSRLGFKNSDVNIDIQFPAIIEGFSLSKLGNFNLQDIEKDVVIWEHTDSAAGDTGITKEEAPRETPIKRGQVSLILDVKHQPSVPVGQLWVELLRFYALEFNLADLVISIRVKELVSRELKDWPKKRIAIEDPYSVKRNVARTLNSQPVFEYILHCLRTTYKYFALPHKITKSSLLKPLNAITCISEHSKEVINHHPDVQTKDDKLKNSVLAQGPGATSSAANTCKVQPLTLKETAESFGSPPKEEMGNEHISVHPENSDCIQADVNSDDYKGDKVYHPETGRKNEKEKVGRKGKHLLTVDQKRGEHVVCGSTRNNESESTLDLEGFQNPTAKECEGLATLDNKADLDGESTEGTEELEDSLNHFTHSVQGQTSEMIPSDEEEEDDEEEEEEEEPRLTINQREDEDGMANEDELDNTYTGSGDEDALSEEDDELGEAAKYEDVKECGKHVERALLVELNKISLKEENVCEEKNSPVDQSDFFYEFSKLIFTKGKGLDCVRTIEELARVLRKHSGLRNILPITTAKVPIVKFFHLRSGLEVDISLYNTLALHNTRLLSAYSAIDPRVKYLCYTMKVFTKMCDIGDASRGSLSSYAYTLMVLYFLQQRNPPVIPVLQEIYKGEKKPEIFVDGWNIYFFDQIDELPTYWSECGKNTESVGQLWLGLLRFYTEEFDFKEHVISIRRKSLLTTFKKQWTSKYIVIEDPFDLNHNLGAGLSRKMTNFIMKAFINGRRVFGIPVKGFPKDYPSKMEYFFDPDVLTEGELAPNDRCCRICGKIGHFMKDCPMRRKVRRRRDQEDALNQRYPENKEKRSKEDKEIHNKYTEREVSTKEDKPIQCTPQKAKPMRAAADLGREKILRPPVEKWKRQDDKDLREKRCFICGREGHIKKECPQFKGSSGSLSSKYMTQGKASAKRTQQES